MTTTTAHERHGTSRTRMVVSWLLVSIPLLWGVSQTVAKAMALFAG